MISKTSADSIKALALLACLPVGKCEGAVHIAATIRAPANYLGKSLQSLVAEGLVVSQRGHGGGFSLAKLPSAISLFDVICALEDVSRFTKCALGFDECKESSPCPLHNHCKGARETYLNFLKKTTIADLLSNTTDKPDQKGK